jgi:hypothetical protein
MDPMNDGMMCYLVLAVILSCAMLGLGCIFGCCWSKVWHFAAKSYPIHTTITVPADTFHVFFHMGPMNDGMMC